MFSKCENEKSVPFVCTQGTQEIARTVTLSLVEDQFAICSKRNERESLTKLRLS